jgi:hypothetical protein
MVAHLNVLATPLSHNFGRCEEGCTNGGETDYVRCWSHSCYVRMMSILVFETRHTSRVAARFFHFGNMPVNWTISQQCGIARACKRRRWIPGAASCKLNTCRQGEISTRKSTRTQERISNAQAHIPTQPPSPREDARLPGPHEDQERSRRIEPSPRSRPQACLRERGSPRLKPPP